MLTYATQGIVAALVCSCSVEPQRDDVLVFLSIYLSIPIYIYIFR